MAKLKQETEDNEVAMGVLQSGADALARKLPDVDDLYIYIWGVFQSLQGKIHYQEANSKLLLAGPAQLYMQL